MVEAEDAESDQLAGSVPSFVRLNQMDVVRVAQIDLLETVDRVADFVVEFDSQSQTGRHEPNVTGHRQFEAIF